MELSAEDTFRLNILLHNELKAIRIHENSMTVYGLSDKGEAKVELHPEGKHEPYLKAVRELISGHVMGSPGGYPVYLKRWTRMGQTREDNLDMLLKLGEPEAVVAVVNAAGLTNDIAELAWWVDPNSTHAREMLKKKAVVEGSMGKVLADHLVEHLAFEDEPAVMADTVRLVLQPGLVDDKAIDSIWKKGKRKNSYWLGFMMGAPNSFPDPAKARGDYDQHLQALSGLHEQGNPYAASLAYVLSDQGQTYIKTARAVLEKPFNQDVVNLLLDTVAAFFQDCRPECSSDAVIEELLNDAEQWCEDPSNCSAALKEILEAAPELKQDVQALLVISRLGYPVVRPVFSKTTAIGTLMRKKLVPVTEPIFGCFDTLLRKV